MNIEVTEQQAAALLMTVPVVEMDNDLHGAYGAILNAFRNLGISVEDTIESSTQTTETIWVPESVFKAATKAGFTGNYIAREKSGRGYKVQMYITTDFADHVTFAARKGYGSKSAMYSWAKKLNDFFN